MWYPYCPNIKKNNWREYEIKITFIEPGWLTTVLEY
jgi:hypothetical protein